MKFDEAFHHTRNDITGRNLKSPKTRLNGLNNVRKLICQLIPGIEIDVNLIRGWEKCNLISGLEDIKGIKLNGAELSSLNILLRHLMHCSEPFEYSVNHVKVIQNEKMKRRHKLYEIALFLADYIKGRLGEKVFFEFEAKPNWLNTIFERQILKLLWDPTRCAYEAISGKSLEQVLVKYGPIVLSKNSYDIYFDYPLNLYVEFDELQHFNQFRALTLVHYPLLGFEKKWRFDLDDYIQYCKTQIVKPGLSGFHKLSSRDPLFLPIGNDLKQDNRHRQRAFRDMLKDFLGIINSNGVLRIPYHVVSKRTADFCDADMNKIVKYVEEKKLIEDLVKY